MTDTPAKPTLAASPDRRVTVTGLMEAYHGSAVDELGASDASTAHWQSLTTALDELGIDELRSRQGDIDRLLDADGATYHSRESEQPEAWSLDAIPVLVSSQEWSEIERGVTQRAVLLDLVLRDLYSERKLLKRGVIPPELIFDHPGFLRPLDGVALPDQSQLFTYGVDLVRDASGDMTVLGDHTQSPSGAGYALENRVVLSRVFPSIYRDAQVHHVSPYFRSLRAALEKLADGRSDDPRIVVLSPGPRSETAFEHALLASYLGYSLVEGDDLIVRDGCLFMRSLGQLEQVDVVLRRVDAAFCDPLELRPESQLGVPGLVEAVRRGNVSVVNTLGSAVIENPALSIYLGAAARALLGQDLQLGSVQAWWCGDPTMRKYVLEHLDELVCKPVSRQTAATSHFGMTMSSGDLDRLRVQILAEPHRWVAQEAMTMATTPTLTERGIEPRRHLLRTYAVTREGSYTVMPGGLTRVAPDDDTPLISNQFGAHAKDTWVLASAPQRQSEFWLRSGPAVHAADPLAALSERGAENLFWVGRYLERAESVARLLRAVHDRRNTLDTVDLMGDQAVAELLRALTYTSFSWPGFLGEGADRRLAAPDEELFSLACDTTRQGSLAYAVDRLLRSSEAVRDQLSLDTWQATNTLERQLAALARTSTSRKDVVQGTLGVMLQSLLAMHGLIGESMVRDTGWHFLETGRRIERSQQMIRLLRSSLERSLDTVDESMLLESVLVSAESIITYRRRYRSRAQVETMLDLLVSDPGNPRSVRFQIDRLEGALSRLPVADDAEPSKAQSTLVGISTRVRAARFAEMAEPDDDGVRTELTTFLDHLEAQISTLAIDVANHHFVHLQPRRSLDVGDSE